MRILLTSTLDASFIREDLAILRRSFSLRHLETKGFFSIPRILRGVWGADITITWFASVYSFVVVVFARMLGRKSMIIVGGADGARCPEIGYGIWLSRWKSVLVRHAVVSATRVLVVDPFFRTQLIRLARYDGENIESLPTGYDPGIWYASGRKRDRRVLTIAGCDVLPRLKIKGIPFLLDAARRLPDIQFTIVGPKGPMAEWIRREAPPNVEVIPFLSRPELLKYYQQSPVYCQPSYFDGLPNSLCEAMLCECIPVGTNVGGIPTAIGTAGFLVTYGDVDAMTTTLELALNTPEKGAEARNHILENFSLEKRAIGLTRAIEELSQ